jgi:hypothetical protein
VSGLETVLESRQAALGARSGAVSDREEKRKLVRGRLNPQITVAS